MLMHSAIKGAFRKPMKWHKLFHGPASLAFNDFWVSDISET